MSECHAPMPCLDLLGAREASAKSRDGAPPACDFAEARVWQSMGGGWQCLHGCYCSHGISVEWHDFNCKQPREWSRSFHPDSIEVCLNVSGHARFALGAHSLLMGPMSVAIYNASVRNLRATRLPGQRHRFLTVEYSPAFLRRHLKDTRSTALHPVVALAADRPAADTPPFAIPGPLSGEWRKNVDALRKSPVTTAATSLWYESKAVELMAELFFINDHTATSSNRKERIAQQRVDRAGQILRENLSEPPSLKKLGQLVGCSPYHLSRTFSEETGMTIPQYLRQIRMERAAELLKSGKHNVTEAAMQVGYNSLSHFSQAFCEVMGCCPGLYPLGLTRASGHRLATTRPTATRRQ